MVGHLLRVNGGCAVETGRCVEGESGVVKGNRHRHTQRETEGQGKA